MGDTIAVAVLVGLTGVFVYGVIYWDIENSHRIDALEKRIEILEQQPSVSPTEI